MDSDPIGNLLHSADAATSPPASDVGHAAFASRIRRRAARRRQMRRGAAAGAGIVAVALLGTFVAHPPPPPPPPPPRPEVVASPTVPTIVRQPANPDAARLELAQLRDEADRAQAVADRLSRAEAASRQVAAWERSSAAPDPLERVERRREQAALILVHQADRLDRELGRKTEAADAYRDAAERFPQTHWAAVARERLRAMQG